MHLVKSGIRAHALSSLAKDETFAERTTVRDIFSNPR